MGRADDALDAIAAELDDLGDPEGSYDPDTLCAVLDRINHIVAEYVGGES
jgi:hypothetical protein